LIVLDQHAQTTADDHVVVNDHDSYGARGHGLNSNNGIGFP
jgi:hypothetical protein